MLEFPTIWCVPTAHVNTAAIHAPTQSQFDITDIPADISIAAANSNSKSLEVVFSPDEHRSTFAWAWLDAHRLGSADVRTGLAKDLRQAADLEEVRGWRNGCGRRALRWKLNPLPSCTMVPGSAVGAVHVVRTRRHVARYEVGVRGALGVTFGEKGTCMLSLIAGNWWAPAASGVLAIAVGLAAFVWPGKTFEALVLLFGVYVFVRGSIWLAFGLLAAGARERWWPFVVNGIIGLGLGVLTFAETRTMAVALVSLAGAWAILTGSLEVVAAFRFRQFIANEWLLGIGGVASIVFGVAVLAQPEIGIVTFALVFGTYAVLVGIAQVWLGLRLRSLGASVRAGTATVERAHP
jgi:uncharacterized membrane protein HdeD (DUF308 family)